jgi:hypothetical protein
VASGATIHKIGEEPLHNLEEGPNPSITITWTGVGANKVIDYIEKTIGSITWRKTFTYDGSNDIISVSSWVEQ